MYARLIRIYWHIDTDFSVVEVAYVKVLLEEKSFKILVWSFNKTPVLFYSSFTYELVGF